MILLAIVASSFVSINKLLLETRLSATLKAVGSLVTFFLQKVIHTKVHVSLLNVYMYYMLYLIHQTVYITTNWLKIINNTVKAMLLPQANKNSEMQKNSVFIKYALSYFFYVLHYKSSSLEEACYSTGLRHLTSLSRRG